MTGTFIMYLLNFTGWHNYENIQLENSATIIALCIQIVYNYIYIVLIHFN